MRMVTSKVRAELEKPADLPGYAKARLARTRGRTDGSSRERAPRRPSRTDAGGLVPAHRRGGTGVRHLAAGGSDPGAPARRGLGVRLAPRLPAPRSAPVEGCSQGSLRADAEGAVPDLPRGRGGVRHLPAEGRPDGDLTGGRVALATADQPAIPADAKGDGRAPEGSRAPSPRP